MPSRRPRSQRSAAPPLPAERKINAFLLAGAILLPGPVVVLLILIATALAIQ